MTHNSTQHILHTHIPVPEWERVEPEDEKKTEWANDSIKWCALCNQRGKYIWNNGCVIILTIFCVNISLRKMVADEKKAVDLVSVLANGRYEFICLRYALEWECLPESLCARSFQQKNIISLWDSCVGFFLRFYCFLTFIVKVFWTTFNCC